jgi:hypothetical protein
VWGVAPLSASAAEDGDWSPGTAPWAIASSRQLTASSRRPARVPHTSLCSPYVLFAVFTRSALCQEASAIAGRILCQ